MLNFPAKVEEELQNQKLTNQMFVQAKEEETSLNAATFISVVNINPLNLFVFYNDV